MTLFPGLSLGRKFSYFKKFDLKIVKEKIEDENDQNKETRRKFAKNKNRLHLNQTKNRDSSLSCRNTEIVEKTPNCSFRGLNIVTAFYQLIRILRLRFQAN